MMHHARTFARRSSIVSGGPFAAFSSSFSSGPSSGSSSGPSSSPQVAALGLLSLAGAVLCGLSPGREAMNDYEDHEEQEEPSGRMRPTKKKRRQNLKLFAGNGNINLASKISHHLQVPLGLHMPTHDAKCHCCLIFTSDKSRNDCVIRAL